VDASGKHGKMCGLLPSQYVCEDKQWSVVSNKTCHGLETVRVEYTGEVVSPKWEGYNAALQETCSQACCEDAQCIFFQVEKKSGQLKQGKKVKCMLGKSTLASNVNKFSCSEDKQHTYLGYELKERGCSDGKFACLLTHECVRNCAASCYKSFVEDANSGICIPKPENPSSPESEETYAIAEVPEEIYDIAEQGDDNAEAERQQAEDMKEQQVQQKEADSMVDASMKEAEKQQVLTKSFLQSIQNITDVSVKSAKDVLCMDLNGENREDPEHICLRLAPPPLVAEDNDPSDVFYVAAGDSRTVGAYALWITNKDLVWTNSVTNDTCSMRIKPLGKSSIAMHR
jgi:hypothetical protein